MPDANVPSPAPQQMPQAAPQAPAGAQGAPYEIVPKVEEVSFPGRLTGTLEEIKAKMATIPFYATKLGAGELTIVRVESRNIHKKPFLFYIITIRQDGLTLSYSIAPDTSDKMRRAYVLKETAGVLSVIAELFSVDEMKFYQYIDSVIDNVLGSLSQNANILFNKYDSLLNEYRELKKLAVELSTANRNLTIQTAQLSDQNKSLDAQLKALQTYSDESLMAMIEDWIQVHGSSIDVNEFATTYKILPPRVEQVLDKMVSLGYIEVKS